jgi:hypothetical protein
LGEGRGEGDLCSLLHHNGNPTAHNLSSILRRIVEDLQIAPRVEVAAV